MSATTPWRLDRIPTEDLVLTDMLPNGTLAPVRPDAQPRAGLEVAHWWARAIGAAWLARARVMLAQVVAAGAAASPEAIWKVFACIANVYNAWNLPWYMHPTARNIYRTFMAGPPQVPAAGGGSDRYGYNALFNDQWNYSRYNPQNPGDYTEGWYRPKTGADAWSDRRRGDGANTISYPVGTSFRGVIPQRGRLLFVSNYPRGERRALGHPNNFVAWVDMDLAVPASSNEDQSDLQVTRVAYRATVMNVLYPFATVLAEVASMGACRMAGGGPVGVVGNGGSAALADGADCGGYVPGMRSFGFDVTPAIGDEELAPSESLRMATPIAEYVAWAQAWLDALARETPEQVVVLTRYYTIYVNAMQADFTRRFADAVAQVDRDVLAQQHTPSPDVTRVSAGITAVGGIVAAAVPGVGTVIGGIMAVVGQAALLIDRLLTHGTTNKYKDDLGRYKPTFERSILGGDPLRSDTSGEPRFDVPAPPPLPRAPGSTISGLDPDVLGTYQAAMGDLARATVAPVADLSAGDRASSDTAANEPATGLIHHPLVGVGLGFVVGLLCVRIATS